MTGHSKRAVKLLWSALAAALVALWPPPAQAGHAGHRLRHSASRQQRLQRHPQPTRGARVVPAAATATAPTAPNPSR